MLATKEAIYFMCHNTQSKPDPNDVRAVLKYKEKKSQLKDNKQALKSLIVPAGYENKWSHLKAKLACKLHFENLQNLELEKSDPDGDSWTFTVEPGATVIKKLVRISLDEPGTRYKYKIKTKLAFKF